MAVKRIFLFLLALAFLTLSFVGCSKEKEPAVPPNPTGAFTEPDTPTEPNTPTEPDALPTEPNTPTEPDAPPTDPAEPPATTGDAIAALAQSLIGTPFAMGGTGPDRFDNSGFVYYCCRQNGIKAPRRTSEMVNYGVEVAWEDLQPGDVVLFSDEVGGPATFEGIYIGAAQFVSCNNPDTPTKVSNMAASYWKDRFIGGRRAEE